MATCKENKRVPLRRWIDFYVFSADFESFIKSVWLFNCILITWTFEWGKLEDLQVAWRPGGE